MEVSIKLSVNDIPPSNNRFIGRNGMNWKYNQIKKEWDLKIYNALSGAIIENPFNKARVHIHYIFPDKRRRDPDNYSGKMILDPLVKYGIIIDDSFKVIDLELSSEVIPKVKRTEVEIICLG